MNAQKGNEKIMDNEQVVKRIKEILKSKGITQKKMLEDCGYGINYLAQIAAGRETSFGKLEKIADYLNVDLSDILYGGEEGKNSVFYDRLQEACAANDVKLTPLLRELNIGTGNIGNWKKGKAPGGEILSSISIRLNVSTDWLLGKDAAVTPEEVKEINRKIDDLSEDEKAKVNEYIDFILSQRKNEKKEDV